MRRERRRLLLRRERRRLLLRRERRPNAGRNQWSPRSDRRRWRGGRGGGRRARVCRAERRQLPHALVAGGTLEQHHQQLLEEVSLLRLVRDAGGLLLHLDGLRGLAKAIERARQEAEGLQILGVRLERDLKLRQRRHRVGRLAALEVNLGREAREARLRPVLEDALDDPQRIVLPADLEEDLGRDGELLGRAVEVADARIGVGQPQVRDRVRRIERDDLLEDVDGVAVAPDDLEAGGHLVVVGERVGAQVELGQQLRELRHDVAEAILQVRGVLLNNLADLLVDRDRLNAEPLDRVVGGYSVVGVDGLGELLDPEVEVPDLEERADVVRVLRDDLLVLRDGLVVALLVSELLRFLEDLVAVDRHSGLRGTHQNLRGPPVARRRGGAWDTRAHENGGAENVQQGPTLGQVVCQASAAAKVSQ